MNLSLDELEQRQWLWKGRSPSLQGKNRYASGYAQLDQYLAGGWPDSGVIELRLNQAGIGELRLILPLLQQLSEQDSDSLQFWINPPARLTPYALPWQQRQQILVLRPRNAKDTLWAAEQALNSGHCSYLVLWHADLNPAQAKRLQVAARSQNCLAFIISVQSKVHQALAFSMRMTLAPHAQGLTLEVFKQQGWPLPPVTLSLHEHWPQLYRSQNPSMLHVISQSPFPRDAANH